MPARTRLLAWVFFLQLGLLPLGCGATHDALTQGSGPGDGDGDGDVGTSDTGEGSRPADTRRGVPCGGDCEGDVPDASVGGSSGRGEATPESSATDLPANCTPGERLEEPTDLSVEYCVCELDSHMVPRWGCYGPDPDGEPAGGARGAPPAHCAGFFSQSGDEANCLVTWGTCSDGHSYAISCVRGTCFCIVDNEPTVEAAPNTGCPEDFDTLNQRCGWALKPL